MRLILITLFILISYKTLCQSEFKRDTLYAKPNLVMLIDEVDSLIIASEMHSKVMVDSSIVVCKKALSISQRINYTEGKRSAYYQLGRSYIRSLDYQKALACLKKSLELTDTLSNRIDAANTINNMGIVYHLSGDRNKALNYYFNANRMAGKKSEARAKALYNIGIVYAENGEFERSATYFHKSYIITHEVVIRDKSLKPHIQANLAEVYNQIGEPYLAERAAGKAITDTEALGDAELESSLYVSLGSTYRSLGQFSKAEAVLQKAIVSAKEAKNIRREQEATKFLVEVYKEKGNFEKAYKAYERYNALKDSTFTVETNRQIIELEASFEAEKKEKEIAILQKEADLAEAQVKRWRHRNYYLLLLFFLLVIFFIFLFRAYKQKKKLNDSLLTSESQLQESNSLKSNLIRIIGHDLKGPIGSVAGFAELLTQIEGTANPAKIKQYSNIIHQTSMGISYLLDNILYWARIQQGSFKIQPVLFHVKKTISNCMEPLSGMAEKKNISLIVNCTDELEAYGDPFTCAVVIGNLLNNAIKFSEPKSEVKVSAFANKNDVIFEISDQGVGMNQDQLTGLFNANKFNTTRGTEDEKGTGLGLKICKEFIELNKGGIEVKSTPRVGTTFIFTFPLKADDA